MAYSDYHGAEYKISLTSMIVRRPSSHIIIYSPTHSLTHSLTHSFNQSINQSISQSVSQSINQSFIHSINQSFIQSINQSINQLINRWIQRYVTHIKFRITLRPHGKCPADLCAYYRKYNDYLLIHSF